MTETRVCPECHSTCWLSKNPHSISGGRQHDADYACKACGAHFDEHDHRDVEYRGPSHGLAAQLATLGAYGDDPLPQAPGGDV